MYNRNISASSTSRKLKHGIQLAALSATMVLGIASLSIGASAQAPALSFITAPTSTGAFVLGWQFTVNPANSLLVSSLGWFDDSNNGLTQAHTVGIYNSVGALLVSAVVPTGTSGTLFNGYRYTSITPFMLTNGQSYTIAGTNTSDIWAYGGTPAPGTTGLTFDSNITVSSNPSVLNANGGATLAFPTVKPNQPTGYKFFGGPNFRIGGTQSASTPEPGTMALFVGVATAGLFLLRRRVK
jgi:hypothetical protein